MKQKVTLFLMLLLCAAGARAQITLKIITPVATSPGPDLLDVAVSVQSTYQLSSVTASVGGPQIALVYNASTKHFEGNISLLSLTEGDNFNLIITATDVFGNLEVTTRRLLYDNPPKVTFIQPLDSFTASPTLFIKLHNTDIDSCTVNIYKGKYDDKHGLVQDKSRELVYTSKIKDSLAVDINLDGFTKDGIMITVTDGQLQKTSRAYYVYVLSPTTYPNVSLLYKGTSKILSVRHNNAFAVGDSSMHPRTIDISTNKEVLIPFNRPVLTSVTDAFATDHGAVFTEKARVYDWNDGVLDSLGIYNKKVNVAGNYLLWLGGDTRINLKNLATKQVRKPAKGATVDCDVIEDGTVVYRYERALYLDQNGVKTTIAPAPGDSQYEYYIPVTDGKYVAYTGREYQKDNADVYLYNDTNNIFLNTIAAPVYSPYSSPSSFKLKNKYMAWLKLGIADETQVWLRDTAGNSARVSFLGSSSLIEEMNANGDIMLINSHNRYLALRNGPTVLISRYMGKAYYQDSSWYIYVGNTIFKVGVTDVLPLRLLSFSASAQGSTNRLEWKTAQELDTAGFDIERGSTTKDFIIIGHTAAASNSAATKTYSFIDAQPMYGFNYYRLKMIDKNGKYTYSDIKAVNNTTVRFNAQLYPNPVHNTATLRFNARKTQQAQIEVVDINGKIVLSSGFTIVAGNTARNIETKQLPGGTYIIRIKTSEGDTTVKFIKE